MEKAKHQNSPFDLNLLIKALDTTSDGLLIVDSDYTILYSNASASFLLGGIKEYFDLNKWTSMFKVFDIRTKAKIQLNDMPIPRALKGQRFNDEIVFVTTADSTKGYYISCNGTPIKGAKNEIVACVITFRDVTKNYFHERELSQEKAFYKNFLDHIPASIFARNDHLDYVFTNQTFDSFIKDLEKFGDPRTVLKKYVEEVKAHDEEVLATLKAKEFEESIELPDGSVRYFRTVRFPLYHQQSKSVVTGVIAFDVTERLNMEKKLEEERTRNIHASKLASIGTLAAEIGHEIHNPITIIKSVTFLLNEMLDDGELQKAFLKEKLNTIDSTIDRITKIIKALKNLSRKNLGETKETCTLRKVFSDVLVLAELKLRKNEIQFIFDSHNPLLDEPIDCIPVQIGEVMMNLISNAVDAVEGQARPWIKMEVKDTDELLKLIIKDSGPGIPTSLQDRIFEPFFTTKEQGKGTGLGLSISKNIMRNHGGDIKYVSSEGETCFVIEIVKSLFDKNKYTISEKSN